MRKSRLLFMHTHTSRYSPLPSAHNMMWRQKHSEFSRLHHYPSNSFFLYYWRERENEREREREREREMKQVLKEVNRSHLLLNLWDGNVVAAM